ncbi:RES domain-containing protein [Pantoea agglomerans]|jgi:RES domain-containing protein|uniref:RES domain-containing protein n=1 Tax=Enterobacter agglomerans TaxID=549 RepID=A0A7X2MIC5_ENTAG|nr:RES domain-containing protein [Pantoea agglomerans]MSE13660.1 RES domain-containing protein [Pantoea agglomerans]
MNEEKYICDVCIEDSYVSQHIRSHGQSGEPCSYCGQSESTIELSEIADRMHDVFNGYYTSYFDNEHNPFGATTEEIISEELGVDESACRDIFELLCEKHNEWQNEMYSDFYVYVKDAFEVTEFDYTWKKIKKSLETESRYFNSSLRTFFDQIFSGVDQTYISSGATVRTIDENYVMYRARAFDDYNKLEAELEHPERNFGPPPSARARAGRMNAPGVPVFYGAASRETAIAEVRPAVGSVVVVAPFRPTRPMRILDLSALEHIVIKEGSLFDPETRGQIEVTSFLRTLSRKLTVPVTAARTDSEYLITQAVSEYLSISDSLNLDGIMFHSTQSAHPDNKDDAKFNIVLFRNSSRVRNGAVNGIKYRVDMYENAEDDHWYPSPSITSLDEEKLNQRPSGLYKKFMNADLVMDTSGLEVHFVTGVQYHTFPADVELKHSPDQTGGAKTDRRKGYDDSKGRT